MALDESSGTTGGAIWAAHHVAAVPALKPPAALPTADTEDWKSLLPHRRAAGPNDGRFRPGWARLCWHASGLGIDFVFAAANAHNAATRLNERTHLLGDVGEVFLQWLGSDRYIEIHVTPENQRLQLAWNGDALQRVRSGIAALADFAVPDPAWVQSVTRLTPTQWSARLLVPVRSIAPELHRLDPGTPLRTAVCRYDYAGSETPVLSSTTDFQGQPFHTRTAWDRLVLRPPDA